ncbi:hypothetical protein [Rariglobus hedericola]|uniref:PEP-CTERM sorting domain-containing protein n=1 Tax=Rariglobus hedericola TaxID=2597822 RepID=A0A556QRD3_9BACT|nr:hypothetical protein [Rariglobus hedericola]TSJ79183.1 hypothetical protein FPL22_07780 [Rariglobus hedericola]
MKLIRHSLLAVTLAFLGLGAVEVQAAGSATDIAGLYYTGQTSTGSLQSGGGRDAHWDVTYAYVNGTRYRSTSNNSYADTTYTSVNGAYVLSSTANSGGANNYIDGAYTPNTSSAQWITAPGAMTTATGGTANAGGDFLPGNGTSGSNSAFYVYQLAFTIVGTGSGVATNNISISLTIAADDSYDIYVSKNQVSVSSGGSITSDYGISASGTAAWNNTTAVSLQNYGSSSADNTTFNIGTNYLTIVVRNSNSVDGSSSNADLNPSGLLVYQVGALATINGNPVPEVGTMLPLLGAVGLYGAFSLRRGRRSSAPVFAA